jgi:hypothetical protein
MTPHEIFSRIPEAQLADIFTFLMEKEKPLYKATIEALAKQRKLRPVFVERKPRTERHLWLREAMSRKSGDSISAQILQIWLVGRHAKLLCDFLDALGIKHDENGTVEELPGAPAKEDLQKAVDALFQAHDAGLVQVYLHSFHALNNSGWPALGELLESDARLQF